MGSPYLQALCCSKCGAGISAVPGQQLLACSYCGQTHVFVPPPPRERSGTRYTPGEPVAVEWGGHWWPATVRERVGEHEWRIHFDGWTERWDIVVGPSRIRHISQATRRSTATSAKPVVVIALAGVVVATGITGFVALAGSQPRSNASSGPADSDGPGDPQMSYQPQEAVEIWWGGRWWQGHVLVADKGRYKITYDGWSSSWDEWVGPRRLRSLASAPGAASSAAR